MLFQAVGQRASRQANYIQYFNSLEVSSDKNQTQKETILHAEIAMMM